MKHLLLKILLKVAGQRRVRSLHAVIGSLAIHRQRPAVWQPESGNIAVLAPHMDDEVLGCGGTIARHVLAGANVSVIFMTDGRHGGESKLGLTESERVLSQESLVKVRKDEARLAARVLGASDVSFLDAEDGRLDSDPRVSIGLRLILERVKPDVVYLPFLLENHPDHVAVSQKLLAATAGTQLDFECRCYEVWTPLFPNILVEIDITMELKTRALACYSSQLAIMDYLHTCIGLNAYRSSALGCKAARFVEAFYSLPLADLRTLHRRMRRFL
jgi:N-acetylglucosamine malate deacetylase 1